MSREEEAKNPRLFDIRAVERNIRKGLITRKDYEKHLKSLPDVTDKIAPKDAPLSGGIASTRPAEYVPPTIIATLPPPSAEAADEGDDLDDDELDDDDLEDLDDDDLDDEPNGARGGGEEPPTS
jgi:hypothetical protein